MPINTISAQIVKDRSIRDGAGIDAILFLTKNTGDPFAARMAHMNSTNEGNIYQSIGVEPIINCRGTFTIIGGSVELPEVLEAMEAASGYFVQYDELAEGVGAKPVSYTHLTLPTTPYV